MRAEMARILKGITIAWEGFAAAPVMVVVAVDPSRDPAHFVEDGALAAQNLCLAAHSLGLGSAWAGVYANRAGKRGVENALKKMVSLPRVGTASLRSFPSVTQVGHDLHSLRIPLGEMVHDEQFRPLQRYRGDGSLKVPESQGARPLGCTPPARSGVPRGS